MKKLLRQTETKLWVGRGVLTSDEAEAIEVKDFTEALRICGSNTWRGMEVVLRFSDGSEVVVPMGEIC